MGASGVGEKGKGRRQADEGRMTGRRRTGGRQVGGVLAEQENEDVCPSTFTVESRRYL